MTHPVIDAEKLEADIAALEKWVTRFACFHDVSVESFDRTFDAARAHLATLPRWKEIEVESWVVVDAQGRAGAFLYHNDADARDAAFERGHDAQVVRLTGTAKVKVTP